ncbi:ABC transporter permease [Actinopolyspora mortivallis]|uniref:ABC transporter permease n=1 Tax=Actinopolyspora mortivallis TaxID=33906 RepID=UPI0021598CFC|nr:ABC transporter permease [Actinopolyspora mortivallis]
MATRTSPRGRAGHQERPKRSGQSPAGGPLPSSGGRRNPFRRLRLPASGKLRAGLGIVTAIVLFGVLGPPLTPDPQAISGAVLSPPSGAHWFGTTQTGQDVLAQLAEATRGSLLVGFVVGVLATALSVVVGVVGGYAGRRTDETLSLLTNVVLVIPSLPLAIVIANYLAGGGLAVTVLVIGVTIWAAPARVLRAQTRSLRERDYVSAAKASGERTWRILFVEILPNLLPVVASQFVFSVVFAVLTEASLAFLGLAGFGQLTWGTLLYYAQNAQALVLGAWWWFVPPGLLMALTGCGLSLINFAIDEVIDPNLRTPARKRKVSR